MIAARLVPCLCAGALLAAAPMEARGESIKAGSARSATVVAVTVNNVTIKLAPAIVPAGTIVFKVRNRGTISRDFSIAGKYTAQIAPGSSTILTAALQVTGFRPYLSVSRHRTNRVAGLLEVLEPCTSPANTTVDMQMAQDHGGITVSQPTIPCGTVTFVVTNTGSIVDSLKVFADLAQGQGSTPELRPGQTATLTIRFPVKELAYYESGNYPPGEPELGEYNEGGQFKIV